MISVIDPVAGLSEDEGPWQSTEPTASSSNGRFRRSIVEATVAICNEFEHYGWRRVRAALRQKGTIVNHKKIRRLMREHDLQPKMHRRFTATTDSDHNQPIFRNLVRDIIPDGPNQLWVADIHIRHHHRRLCLCCHYPRCLAATSCRIRHQPLD
jgi:transposase InsO family protein